MTFPSLLLIAFPLFAQGVFGQNGQPVVTDARSETRYFSGDLARDIRSSAPAWFGYAVKSVRKDSPSCCWSGSNNNCWLEDSRSDGVSLQRTNQSPAAPRAVSLEGEDTVAILLRVEGNRIDKLRLFSLNCPLNAGGLPFIWLTGVPESASVAYLHSLTSGTSDQLLDAAVFAIAQHATPDADKALEELCRPTEPERTREKVMFWLGASRGAPGVALLKKIVAEDPSPEVRDKAVFALSISKQPEALALLIRAANSDPAPHVRGQALFWLAQKAGKQASAAITNAIQNDPDTGVKKKAVFALSQLPKDEGIPKLIEVARTQRNPEVCKQAFFWLGQSQDPRALSFLEQVLTK